MVSVHSYNETEKSHFEELEAATQLCECYDSYAEDCNPTSDNWKEAVSSAIRLHNILDSYLEFPTLIIPHLDSLLNPLISSLEKTCLFRETLSSSVQFTQNDVLDLHEMPEVQRPVSTGIHCQSIVSGFDVDRIRSMEHLISYLLYSHVRIVGLKHVITRFPHSTANLLPVYSALQRWTRTTQNWSDWEISFVLLLWLSNVITTPFPLESFQDNIVHHLVHIGETFLAQPGRLQEAAVCFLSAITCRPDAITECGSVVNSLCTQILRMDEPSANLLVYQTGALRLLSSLCKKLCRNGIARHIPLLWKTISCIIEQRGVKFSFYKGEVKLVQRVVLLHRPENSLTHNDCYMNTQNEITEFGKTSGNSNTFRNILDQDVEKGVNYLIRALCCRDTAIRWSAAKGLSSIACRFSTLISREILRACTDLLEDKENDVAWHGVFLALSECIRKGCFEPGDIKELLSYFRFALSYDIPRGAHSVGTHVRDAACYWFWCVSRTISSSALHQILASVAPDILFRSCYDREVNVRRAAAAAFQEAVGRTTEFPLGIEMITMSNFFTVARRSDAFLDVAPKLASLSAELGLHFLSQLIQKSIGHWDIEFRELAAKGIGVLGNIYREMITAQFPLLLEKCSNPNASTKHGALMALSCVISSEVFSEAALNEVAYSSNKITEPVLGHLNISDTLTMQIGHLVPQLQKSHSFRSRHGELVRIASCELVKSIACSKLLLTHIAFLRPHSGTNLTLEVQITKSYLNFLEDCATHLLESVRSAGAVALYNFLMIYCPYINLKELVAWVDRILEKKIAQLPVNERRGVCHIVGSLPYAMLQIENTVEKIISSLCIAAKIERDIALRDPETRQAGIQALGNIAKSSFSLVLKGGLLEPIFTTLTASIQDYSVDRRGDIGSNIRRASIKSGGKILSALLYQEKVSDQVYRETSKVFLWYTQSCLLMCHEKLDRLREFAANSFFTLLEDLSKRYQIRYLSLFKENDLRVTSVDTMRRDILQHSLCNGSADWSSPKLFDIFLSQSLPEDKWRIHVLRGLVTSLNTCDMHVSQPAREALMQYINTSASHTFQVCDSLMQILNDESAPWRIILPLCRTFAFLLENGKLPEQYFLSLAHWIRDNMNLISSNYHRLNSFVELVSELSVVQENEVTQLSLAIATCWITQSKYPKIRGKMAVHLFNSIVAQNGFATPDSTLGTSSKNHSKLVSILTSESWDDSLSEIYLLDTRKQMQILLGTSLECTNDIYESFGRLETDQNPSRMSI